MRLIRHDLVRRLVAALLVVTMGGTLAPAAVGQGASVRTVLVDEDALGLALAAAHAADAGADPIAVFAEAYAGAVDGVTADAVIRLLGQPSMSGVLPPAADDLRAAAPAAPSPTPAALSVQADAHAPLAGGARFEAEAPRPFRTVASSARPRAP